MVADKRMIKRNNKIRANLQGLIDDAETQFAVYERQCKVREEKRIYYDHYRTKLDKLNSKAAERANKPVTSTTYAFSSHDKEY